MKFISVSAVTNAEELSSVAQIYRKVDMKTPLVIGYQVSHKSMHTGAKNNRQPSYSRLATLCDMTREMGLYPAIHYYTKDNNTIIEDLHKMRYDGITAGLLQFNTLPATVHQLRQAKELGFKSLFKVNVAPPGGFAVWNGGTISQAIEQARVRSDVIGYAMFDPSHGTGHGLDLQAAKAFGRGVGGNLVFAGGIGPDNVAEIYTELKDLGNVSLDTESAVRTSDMLDFEKVKKYLSEFKRVE